MKLATGSVLVMALLLGACSNKLSGEVTVNGEKQTLSSCRSGRAYGYTGVSLVTSAGVRIAIASSQSGAGDVYVFPKDSKQGVYLGACGPFSVSDQNSTINDVKNVEGKAELDCQTDGFSLKGKVSFSNCH